MTLVPFAIARKPRTRHPFVALRGMKWQAVARDRGVAKFCTLAPYGLGKVLLAIGLRPKSRRTLSKIFALLVPRVVHWPDPFTPGGRADRSPGRVFEAGSDGRRILSGPLTHWPGFAQG
jgi:hypothetical protein